MSRDVRGTCGIHVVIVEDHALVREALMVALSSCPEIVLEGEAGSCEAALELATGTTSDVAVVDFSLPDGTGSELIGRLREQKPEMRAIVLSGFVDRPHVEAAMRVGASGYLSKTCTDRSTLVDAIKRVAKGHKVFTPDAVEALAECLHAGSLGSQSLTEREREVWRLLAEGLCNAEIAKRLFVSERTVKFHVSQIMQKLEVNSRAQAVAYAHISGFFVAQPALTQASAGN